MDGMRPMEGQGTPVPQGQMQQGVQEQGADMSSLPSDILIGMQTVGSTLQEAGAPPEILDQLAQAMMIYEGVLQQIGGGQEQPQQQQQQGMM